MIKSDHSGTHYTKILRDLHTTLSPKSYLEIGTETGRTLELATCPSIAVDPNFKLQSGTVVINKPVCHLYQMTSDDFFASHNPSTILGRPIDVAFLDGMHRCEFLLRDFLNTEKFCRRNSIILLHDCLPLEYPMTTRVRGAATASREERQPWWTGDVWRTAQALKQFRPDLVLTAYDAALTGLVAITNLDPASTLLLDRYHEIVDQMMTWELDVDSYFERMNVESTSVIDSEEKINLRFWL